MSDAQSMSDDSIFDSVMNDAPEPTPPVEVVEDGGQTESKTAAVDAQEVTTEPKPSESATSDEGAEQTEPEPKTVPLKAVQEERQKRQQAQAEAEQLRQQLAMMNARQGGAPQSDDPETSIWENPEKFLEKRDAKTRVNMSEHFMRSQHDDFDETVQPFIAAAKANPALLAQFNSHPFPAAFAYEQGKAMQEFGDVKTPQEYRSKVESDIRAEYEAKYAKREEELKAKYAVEGASQVPRTNAGARSAASSAEPVLTDDQIFDDIAG